MGLALRTTFPDASTHALRLTLRRRRLPHGEQIFTPDGSPVYPKDTGAAHFYTSAHTRRSTAWLLPVRGGLFLRFQRNTQTSGWRCPLVQDGYKVELLPKLAFFALLEGPSPGVMPGACQLDGLGGSSPPADPASPVNGRDPGDRLKRADGVQDVLGRAIQKILERRAQVVLCAVKQEGLGSRPGCL